MTLGTCLRMAAILGALGLFPAAGFAQMNNPEAANGTGGGAGGDGGSGSITEAPWLGTPAYPPIFGLGGGYEDNTGTTSSRRPLAGSGRIDSGPIIEPDIGYGESRRRTLRNRSEGE